MSNQTIRSVSILIVVLGLVGLSITSLDIRSFYYGVKYSGFQRTDIIYFMKNSLIFIVIPLLLVIGGVGVSFLKKWAYKLLYLAAILYLIWGVYFIFDLIYFITPSVEKYRLVRVFSFIEVIKRISFLGSLFFVFILIPVFILIFLNQKSVKVRFISHSNSSKV